MKQASIKSKEIGLRTAIAKELFAQKRRTIKVRRRIIVPKPHHLLSIDLAFFGGGTDFRPTLIAIDAFSKKGFAIALKNKTQNEILRGIKIILKKHHTKHIRSDNGKEFVNERFQAHMKAQQINHYFTNNEIKASIAERFIRSLRAILNRLLFINLSQDWTQYLSKAVDVYNNSYHSAIKMTPNKVDFYNIKKVKQALYGKNSRYWRGKKHQKQIFKIGDSVRVSTARKGDLDMSLNRFTREIFKIKKIDKTQYPQAYILEDLLENEIKGIFYALELKKVANPKPMIDHGDIEKIIKKQKGRVLVKWRGWPKTFNSWVDAKNLISG